jgi:hypothetical protein
MWRSYTDEQLGKEGWHTPVPDNINHPTHYKSHPSGIEPIEITKHESFNIGNAIKYIMRRNFKGKPLEDLKKARFYLDMEISMLEEGE